MIYQRILLINVFVFAVCWSSTWCEIDNELCCSVIPGGGRGGTLRHAFKKKCSKVMKRKGPLLRLTVSKDSWSSSVTFELRLVPPPIPPSSCEVLKAAVRLGVCGWHIKSKWKWNGMINLPGINPSAPVAFYWFSCSASLITRII